MKRALKFSAVLAVLVCWSSVLNAQTAAGGASKPHMLFGDASRNGRPFAKDPCVIRFQDRYLMYYSMPPSAKKDAPQGWAVGIAESTDLVRWKKIGEILPEQPCESNGLVNGKAIVLQGRVHLFYNSYGNAAKDALCHAVSEDGIRFARDPSNPILSATGSWNSGRAIDCDAFPLGEQLILLFATRDPEMKTQMLVAAAAPLNSDFGRSAWKQLGNGPVLRPELPWETKCIEAPSVIRKDDRLYLFYGGGYNNDPQQIGCATSTDGVHWTRLFREPLIPNGPEGTWNSSETGHPGVFEDVDGKTYLFVQGNAEKGKTWFLSCYEIDWKEGRPEVRWDSQRFPMRRPGTMPHSERGFAFSKGWTCWSGPGPIGGGLHSCNEVGATATVESRGAALRLIYKAAPDCGIARLLVDGKPATPAELDTYSKEVDWNRQITIPLGGPGLHTVTIEVAGRKNALSTNTLVQLVECR